MPVSELPDGSPLTIDWLNSIARTLQAVETKVNNMDSIIISTSAAGDKPSPIPDLAATSTYQVHFGVAVVDIAKGAGEIKQIDYGVSFSSPYVFVLPYFKSSYISSVQVFGQNKTQFSVKYYNHTASEIKGAQLLFMAVGQK